MEMKSIKLAIILMCLLMSAEAKNINSLYKELHHLSAEQKQIMKTTWKKGKDIDLHYTLTAIAWQESNFGKYKVGRWSPDYGVFQININTYKRRYKDEVEKYKLKDKHIKKYLTHNYLVGFIAAVDEILFWQEVHGNNWNKIWASYNDGTVISKKGLKYSESIAKRIKALKKYHEEGLL